MNDEISTGDPPDRKHIEDNIAGVINDAVRRLSDVKQLKRRWKRSTLSKSNTDSMMPWINLGITEMNDFEIPCFVGVSLSSMYQKWRGAIQYINESFDYATDFKRKVALLDVITKTIRDEERGVIRIRFTADPRLYFENKLPEVGALPPREKDGVKLSQNRAKSKAQEQNIEVVNSVRAAQGTDWKAALIEWLSAGEASEPFIRKNMMLTVEDIEFVKSLATTADLVYEVSMTHIKLSK